jgi:hypothetical protein
VFILKKISRTSWPVSMTLGTNHPWVKRIENCSKEGPGCFPRGDNHMNTKVGWNHFKIILSRTTEPQERIFTGKLSDIMYIVDSSLFKSWSTGVRRGHKRVKYISICFNWKNLFKKPPIQKRSFLLQGDLMQSEFVKVR